MKFLPVAIFACALLVLAFFGLYLRDWASFALNTALSSTNWEFTKERIEVFFSLPLLGGAFFVLLDTRYGPKDKYWAYATIGALIGFWLHPQRA